MRIALSGAPGTGKTTLGKLITKETCLDYIPEIEDVIAQEDGYTHTGQIRDVLGHEGLIDNFFRSLKRKREIEAGKENFITDKCMLDLGARWFANMWEGTTKEQHDEVRRQMRLMASENHYDRIIYMPFHFDRETDYGMGRTTDTNLRYKRSILIKGLAQEFGVNLAPYEYLFSDEPLKVVRDLNLEAFTV